MLVGILEGDSVSLAGGTAVFADAGAGEGITVTVTGLELTGPSAGNYVLSETTATLEADITAKTLSVTGISVENRVYDGTADATLDLEAAALDGVVDGDDVVLVTAEAVGAFADADAGEGKPLTVTGLSLGGEQSANYTLAELVLAADITAKTLSVTGTVELEGAGEGRTTEGWASRRSGEGPGFDAKHRARLGWMRAGEGKLREGMG